MSEVVPKPGEFVLFRDSKYERVAVEVAQVAKVTPMLVKFDSGRWPRQCSRIAVVAALPTLEAALDAKGKISGVAGEFNRRRRAAEDEKSRRITDALTAANRQIEAIIAKVSA